MDDATRMEILKVLERMEKLLIRIEQNQIVNRNNAALNRMSAIPFEPNVSEDK